MKTTITTLIILTLISSNAAFAGTKTHTDKHAINPLPAATCPVVPVHVNHYPPSKSGDTVKTTHGTPVPATTKGGM